MKILASFFFGLIDAQISCNRECPKRTDYKWCREHIKDYITVPDYKQEEIQNPTRRQIDIKEDCFENYARPLLDAPRESISNAEISELLIYSMSNLHSFEGWVIAVFDSNSEGCGEYNGIDDVNDVNYNTCFDKWYTGCRTDPNAGSSTRACRNSLVESSRQGRLAFASQVDQRVSNMLKIDKKHVHWFSSHAEGCDDQKYNGCQKIDQFAGASAEVYQEHIQSQYGLSSKNIRLDVPVVQKMGAKMIWQNYRQGLDREFSSINDHYCADWDVLLTLCSTNEDPSSPDFGDIGWRTSNLNSEFFVTDYRQFEVGIQDHWFGNNKIEQCVTLYVSPFSH